MRYDEIWNASRVVAAIDGQGTDPNGGRFIGETSADDSRGHLRRLKYAGMCKIRLYAIPKETPIAVKGYSIALSFGDPHGSWRQHCRHWAAAILQLREMTTCEMKIQAKNSIYKKEKETSLKNWLVSVKNRERIDEWKVAGNRFKLSMRYESVLVVVVILENGLRKHQKTAQRLKHYSFLKNLTKYSQGRLHRIGSHRPMYLRNFVPLQKPHSAHKLMAITLNFPDFKSKNAVKATESDERNENIFQNTNCHQTQYKHDQKNISVVTPIICFYVVWTLPMASRLSCSTITQKLCNPTRIYLDHVMNVFIDCFRVRRTDPRHPVGKHHRLRWCRRLKTKVHKIDCDNRLSRPDSCAPNSTNYKTDWFHTSLGSMPDAAHPSSAILCRIAPYSVEHVCIGYTRIYEWATERRRHCTGRRRPALVPSLNVRLPPALHWPRPVVIVPTLTLHIYNAL